MKKRILLFVSVSVFVLLTLGGSATALAWRPRRIAGDVAFHSPPEWYADPPMKLWVHYNVYETNRKTHQAWGKVSAMIYSEQESGWRYVDFRPTCVVFGKHEGKPAAVIVAQIVEKIGWGWGEPGEYGYFWVRDGGTPADEGDQWGMVYYSADPFIEYFPEDDPPACEYLAPDLPIGLEGGDLTIRR